MRTVYCPKYGPPEVLEIREVEKPKPKKNEVLVKNIASSVNTGDARIRGLRVEGFMKVVMRLIMGFNKPRQPILGTVFSGVIEEVGEGVSQFKVGDEVFGTTGLKQGCHCEYISASVKNVITHKPKNASFEEAAALPFGGQTSTYFLRKGGIENIPNAEVLIYGATGSVGAAGVQIAKYYGAKVTAVCSSRGKEMTEKLGADTIILYDKEDFTKRDNRFDIIFDTVGKTTKKACKALLKESGKFFTVEGMDVAAERTDQLEFLRELFEKHSYQANIDRVYPMEEVADAHTYVDSGRKKGNVILKLSD